MVIIDSGSTGNFVSKSFTRQHPVLRREKARSDQYSLELVDGTTTRKVDKETIPLPLAIQQYYENITLDVVEMATHEIILGIPWLKKHNPIID